MQRDQPVWLLRFPPVGQQTAPTADRPEHCDRSHRGGCVRLADDWLKKKMHQMRMMTII